MKNLIVCEREVELLDEKYVVYLKRVATKIASGGIPISTTVKAFVRKNISKKLDS